MLDAEKDFATKVIKKEENYDEKHKAAVIICQLCDMLKEVLQEVEENAG